MTKKELNWLYKMAQDKNSIVEIGSWKGRSTHALLSACKGIVTAVDHFRGSPGEVEQKGQHPYKDFIKNVGHFKNLKILKMSSEKAVKLVKSVEMIFIDGAHDYDSVKKDIEMWALKATKLICGHDFNWPGVRQAVTEKFGSTIRTKETIWYKRLKQGDETYK